MTTTIFKKKSACPYCGYEFDAATSLSGNKNATPAPGDITICIACASIMMFEDYPDVRKLTEEEYECAMDEPRLKRAVEIVREMRKSH